MYYTLFYMYKMLFVDEKICLQQLIEWKTVRIENL